MAKSKKEHAVPNVVRMSNYDDDVPTVVQAPDDGVIGVFLQQTSKMLQGRAERMAALLQRIDQSGKRTEAILGYAAEKMEAAEMALLERMTEEGLIDDLGTTAD